jgi:hypothetical protein
MRSGVAVLMTSEERFERIRELTAHPPRVERHGWDLFWHRAQYFFAVVASVALVIALVALLRVASVAFCINANLGSRNPTSALDAQAHLDFATALQSAFHPPPGTTKAENVKALNQAVIDYKSVLAADKKYRESHPLGRC